MKDNRKIIQCCTDTSQGAPRTVKQVCAYALDCSDVTCIVDVNEDKRKEPPNPREPIELIDDDINEGQVAERAAHVANLSQQSPSPSLSRPLATQVHCSLKGN